MLSVQKVCGLSTCRDIQGHAMQPLHKAEVRNFILADVNKEPRGNFIMWKVHRIHSYIY